MVFQVNYCCLFGIVTLLGITSVVEGVRCPSPPCPVNAKVVLSNPSLEPSTVATFTCDDGYDLFGSSSLVCSTEGTWPGELPFCGTNVAYRRPSNQSSSSRGGNAGNANDGERTTVHDGKRCSETQKEVAPWWRVDLLRPYAVRAVRLTTRGCCGHQPLQEIEIRVGNSSTVQRNPLCAWYPATLEEGVTKMFHCARPMVGQHVSVQMVGVEGSLSLCEVEVFSTDEFSRDRCLPSSESTDLVTIFDQTCYEFQVKEGKAFSAARTYCQSRGGDLVWDLTEASTNFMLAELERRKDNVKTKLIWIGAQREPAFTSRTWRWVNGDVVTRPAWGKDQPNNYNGEQNCVVLDGGRDWLWNDVGCNLDYLHWICQFRPASCGSPDNAANTTILGNSHKVNATIQYVCPEGHFLDGGNVQRTCMVTGFWSGKAPTCKYIDCKPLLPIPHGRVQLVNSSSTFGSIASYSCEDNYTLVGESRRNCQKDGKWDGKDPVCSYGWCPPPSVIINGLSRSTGQKAGDTITFTCSPGYVMSGQPTLTCELGGKWSGSSPTCRFVDCAPPPQLDNGFYQLTNGSTVFGSIVRYQCGEDFWMDRGDQERTCLATGRWSGEEPVCELIMCEEPEVPEGSFVTGYEFTVHSTIEYHCEQGHLMQGSPTRECNRDGKWSGKSPTCIFIDCGRVTTIPFGSVLYVDNTVHLGSEIRYNCSKNYQLQGSDVRFCQENRQWSGETPSCREIRCGEPERPPNSVISITNTDRTFARTLFSTQDNIPSSTYKVSSLLKYRCERGYKVVGEPLTTCDEKGRWSGRAPVCVYVDCSLPAYLAHGRFILSSNATYFGAAVLYECEKYYSLIGHGRRLCLENGTWSSETPTCQEIQCPEPEKYDKTMTVEVSNHSIGGLARYSCQRGQFLKGNDTRLCQESGHWNGKSPMCQWVDCLDPGEIINGRIYVVNQSTVYNSVVEYHCFPGHRRVGPYLRKCMEDAQWSGTQPVCQEDPFATGDDNSVGGYIQNENPDSLESQLGIWIGVAAGIIVIIVLILAVIFFKMRRGTPVKNTENVEGIVKKDNQNAEVMSYAALNDNYNHIYDNVSENTYENIRGPFHPDPNCVQHRNGHLNDENNHRTNSNGACVTINGVAVL